MPPQIVVCGDRSSGKSSVLEAITGINFPKKQGFCTCFTTELVLRQNAQSSASIRISPGTDRSSKDKQRMASFECKNAKPDIHKIINDAKVAMGINGSDRLLGSDILHIEISGPKYPDLTLVDLPGLFLPNSGQNGKEKDARLARSLMLSYMQNPRSIILAVISASSDFAQQRVIGHARAFDLKGARTLGIITNPDTLAKGSNTEELFVGLARNQHVRLDLGWHVLRNRCISGQILSISKHLEMESEFFSRSAWASLDSSQLGAKALRVRLGQVLLDRMLDQVVGVLPDIEKEITKCRVTRSSLEAPRPTVPEQQNGLPIASTVFSKKPGVTSETRGLVWNMLDAEIQQIAAESDASARARTRKRVP
ncbi:P-loop containing nucleoside triphosphate hydrolase protein [Camillea tinctor]|nr:P-loop containing nucleoside triphosphate hydrolase protein [Camillea tinctor]